VNLAQIFEDQNTTDLPVASRYFVAKYMPDIMRMEPKNVGVILWTPSGAIARFVGEDDRGHIDARRLPEWIGDTSIYRDWIAFWRGHCLKGLARIFGPLESLDHESEPRIQDKAITELSKAHWIFNPGGVIMDRVDVGDEERVLNELFERIALHESLVEQIAAMPVDDIVRTLVKALDLKKDPHFHRDFVMKGKVKGAHDYKFNVDYAYAGKNVERIWQTLPVFPHKKQMHTYAEATAFRLELARDAYQLTPDRMQVLYSMTAEQERKNRDTLSMVGDFAQVFNINGTEERLRVFSNLPKLDQLEGTDLSPRIN
jgi:hypothetical protein